jgi:hypothetical protein
MFNGTDIGFLASVLNSLICRRPFFLKVKDASADERLKHLLSFVPAHRYLLVSGTVPKWARYMEGQPRILPSEDPEELAEAVGSSLKEERTGSRPIQFIYFSAGSQVYDGVLKPLGRGWIATTSELNPIVESFPSDLSHYMTQGSDDVKAVHLGERPNDMTFEEDFLKRIKGARTTAMSFLIQKKFSEMYLAGAAIRRDLEESSAAMTMADLEDHFELDESTATTMFQLVRAEHGVDIQRYLTLPGPNVVATVDAIARLDHVIAVAAVEEGAVITIKRLRYSELELSRIARLASRLFDQTHLKSVAGNDYHMTATFPDGSNIVGVRDGKTTYLVFLTKEAKKALSVSEVRTIVRG